MDEPILIDISIPMSADTPPWPGDTPFSCGWTCRREQGDSVNLGTLTSSPHVGTHADAPVHIESDWAASESLPLGAFVGECLVLALPQGFPVTRDISADDLAALMSAACGERVVTRILLRSGYSLSRRVFPDDWPVLSLEATQWLLARGMQLWGTDAPSVDRRTSKDLPVHHALFAGGAFVLETLALDGVTPGVYELLAQPLAIEGADAAPVRALLRR
jgi:arylformamidase